MKIYGDLDLRTGDLYDDGVKIGGVAIVADDTARNALTIIEDGQLAVTKSDYTLNMYDATTTSWKKFQIVDPVVAVDKYNDSKKHIALSTGYVKVPLSNVQYTNKASTYMLCDFYFKGTFTNRDVIMRLTGANNAANSFGITWDEYYGLCICVAAQAFKDTRIFPSTSVWNHFSIQQDYVNAKLDFHLNGYRIYQTPVVDLVNPTQLRLGMSDTVDGYDSGSRWTSGYRGKICQFRLAPGTRRTYWSSSFTVYTHRESPDNLTEIMIQPNGDTITDISMNGAIPQVTAPAAIVSDDSPFTYEITRDLTSADHKTFFHNNNCLGYDLIFNLPVAQNNLVFAFIKYNSTKSFKVKAAFNQNIVGTNGDGSAISLNMLDFKTSLDNAVLILKGNSSNQWEITSIKGTWTDGMVYP